MRRVSIYKSILFILASLAFFACDKNGNPILSGFKFSCEINGLKYKDQMAMFLPPGAQRSPRIIHEKYKGNESILFTSSLTYEEKQTSQSGYYIQFSIPMNGEISVAKKYLLEPIEGREILKISDDRIYDYGGKQFIAITSDYDTYYYGKGSIIFFEFDLLSKKATGQVECTFPYLSEEGKREELHLKGEFSCQIDRGF